MSLSGSAEALQSGIRPRHGAPRGMRDPFAGSGPTLIAAERTGRTCYAVELEPRYCDIILARWEAMGKDKPSRLDT